MRITKAIIEERIRYAVALYKRKAGKEFEPDNGWQQVPRHNDAAHRAYGAIRELESLLED